MRAFRDHLMEGLSPGDSVGAVRWLHGLPLAARREMAVLWDKRGDRCSWSVEILQDGNALWRPLPIALGRPVRPAEVADDPEWSADYFEYRLDHPETWPLEIPPEVCRVFAIG